MTARNRGVGPFLLGLLIFHVYTYLPKTILNLTEGAKPAFGYYTYESAVRDDADGQRLREEMRKIQ